MALLLVVLVVASAVVPTAALGQTSLTGEISISADAATDGSTFSFDLADPDGAKNATATLTGVESTATESSSATALADGGTLPVDVAGTEPARGPASGAPQVTFVGTEETRGAFWSGTASSGSTDSISVSGNRDPTNTTVTFTGSASTGSRYTPTGTGDSTITVNGDLPPVGPSSGGNPTIKFVGRESSTSRSVSSGVVADGASTSYSVGGDQPAVNEQVTFRGETTTANGDASFTGLSPGTSRTFTNGNIAPTGPASGNPRLSVTAHTGSGYQEWSSLDSYLGGGGETAKEYTVGGAPSQTYSKLSFDLTEADTGSDHTGTVRIALVNGESADMDVSDGTVIYEQSRTLKSGTTTVDVQDFTAQSTLTLRITLLNFGESYDFRTQTGAPAGYATWPAGNGGSGYSYNRYGSWVLIPQQPSSVSVSFNDGTTTSIGSMTAGETVTRSVNLSASASSLTVNADAGTFDVSLTKTDRTATENPSVDVDGDGSADASVSGILTEGETKTVSTDGLTPGSYTAPTSTAAGSSVSWTLSFDEVSATTDPSVDVNGDGSADAAYSGVLASGENATVPLDSLTSGSATVDSSTASGPLPDWTVIYDERVATEDPGVDIGNDGTVDAEYSGVLGPGETATVAVSNGTLATGSNQLGFSGSGPAFDWELQTTEHIVTENPALDLNGDGSPDASYSGTLAPGATVSRSLGNVTPGSYSATVATSGWSTTSVNLTYTEVTHSASPTVVVNGNTFSTSSTLAPGEQTTLNISESALVDGENQLVVRVGQELSADAPVPRVGLHYQQQAQTTHETRYNATAWREERWVNKTFAEDQQNATLTMSLHDSVVSVSTLEIARGENASYSRMESAAYSYENGTLTAELGDVSEGETVRIHVIGHRVRVRNGEITIEDPTTPGHKLDTEIRVVNASDGFALGVANSRVLDATNMEWQNPSPESRITADGRQWLRFPNAVEESTARLTYSPLVAEPKRGDVVVTVQSVGDRQFAVDPGQTVGDPVVFTWLRATEGERYTLWSTSHRATYDQAKAAENGVALTDDDSAETLKIIPAQEESISTPLGSQTLRIGAVIGGIAGSFALLYLLMTKYGDGVNSRRDYALLAGVSLAVTAIGVEVVAPGTFRQMLTQGPLPVMVGGALALLTLLFGSRYLPGGRRIRIAGIIVGAVLVSILGLEFIAPGSIADNLGGSLAAGLEPAIRLGGVLGVGLGAYAVWRYLNGGSSGSGGSGGSGSDDSDSDVTVVNRLPESLKSDGGNN